MREEKSGRLKSRDKDGKGIGMGKLNCTQLIYTQLIYTQLIYTQLDYTRLNCRSQNLNPKILETQ